MFKKFYITFYLICLMELHIAAQSPFVIAAYYENWSQFHPPVGQREIFSVRMIDPSLLTDLYDAFAIFGYISSSIDPQRPRLTGNFKIQPLYASDQKVLYKDIQHLKQLTGGKLKTFLSIGGTHFNDPTDMFGMGQLTHPLFSQMVASHANRQQFIQSAIDYAHQYQFDGIDIDWEYPGDRTRGGQPEDFANFVTFLKECSIAFKATHPPLLLSFAASPTIPAGVPHIYHDQPDQYYKWLAECARYLDRITIMAYNYHTPFGSEKITGANAPLYRDTQPNSYLYIDHTLDQYLNGGVPANKIILGIPTYGWSYAGVEQLHMNDYGPGKPYRTAGNSTTGIAGLLPYFEIADMIAKHQLKLGIDAKTNTAYGYHLLSKHWVSFDIPDTIKMKAQQVKKRGLAGVAVWAINLDEYQWEPRYPNVRAIKEVLDHN